MKAVRSNFIYFGDAKFTDVFPDLATWEMDSISNLDLLKKTLSESNCKILVIDNRKHPQSFDFLLTTHPSYQIQRLIWIGEFTEIDFLISARNTLNLWKILPEPDSSQLNIALRNCLSELQEEDQRQDLLRAIEDQSRTMSRASQELTERIIKRQRSLTKAEERLRILNSKIQTLRMTILHIHSAQNVGELELRLTETLHEKYGMEWVRLFFNGQSSLTFAREKSQLEVFSAPLIVGERTVGEIWYGRRTGFSKEDEDALTEIAEVASLALDRLAKLGQAETVKQQWDATFDSIADPICLTDKDYVIRRCNRAFKDLANRPFRSIIGESFLAILTTSHNLQDSFRSPQNLSFRTQISAGKTAKSIPVDLLRHKLTTPNGEVLFLILIRDLTQELELEQQILQSAKMAELGTIGSSIAHEINNPLAGMLSFLQLIKMDLRDSPAISKLLFEDILEMEKATLKCKEIVENLLSFSRREDGEARASFDLCDLFEGVINWSKENFPEIHFEWLRPAKECPFSVTPHLFTQAFKLFIKFVAELKIRQIQVALSEERENYLFLFKVQGANPLADFDPTQHLGLSLAQKILADHNGQLEIFSASSLDFLAKISLQRPDLERQSQVFDSKI